jgi:hypothetical protein
MEYLGFAIMVGMFCVQTYIWWVNQKNIEVKPDEETKQNPLVRAALEMAYCRERSGQAEDPAESRQLFDRFERAYNRLIAVAGDLDEYKKEVKQNEDIEGTDQTVDQLAGNTVVNFSDYRQ